jgi:hypothetical protein
VRKLKWLDITNIDTQHCLVAFNEQSHKLGIKETDVVSVQYIWNENPVDFSDGIHKGKANVTLFIFYWEGEK